MGEIAWTSKATPLPCVVEGDRSFFCQILQNLLDNALKFEDGRGVTVDVRCIADEGRGDDASAATHALVACVADRGRGLSAEQCERCFSAYEASPSSSGGGSGMGLFVARAFARRAGGDVTVVSSPGQGATFTLRFPVLVPPEAANFDAGLSASCSAAESSLLAPRFARYLSWETVAPSVEAGSSADTPQLRCLLVDDALLNLKLMRRLLEAAGFSVETAINGQEAFNKLVTACDAGRPPHIAILDWEMPCMSGRDAARAFRSWEAARGASTAPLIPLFCLTANVLEEHRKEAELAGFDGFFTKPLRHDAIEELRRRAAEQARRLEAA